MFKIDLKNRTPIYEQVVENFKKLIITGVLQQDSRVPSVRDMARDLSVNPNTVQKAYRELETSGYFYTVLGQGSFISAPPDTAGAEITALYEQLKNVVREMVFRGETIEKIGEFIKSMEGEMKNV